jgi:type II secretory pathway pseudopilin PulG
MQQTVKTGFTIIEVLLFLSISSLMAVVLFIGTSAAIQREQYRDAVQSFAGFLQDQYGRVINVENDRTRQACMLDASGTVSERGQSDCVIVGRYIETVGSEDATDGGEYSAYSVYAKKGVNGWEYTRDSTPDVIYALNWSAKTRLADASADNSHSAIIMYRDPDSGSLAIRASTERYSEDEVGNFVENKYRDGTSIPADLQAPQKEVCVYDDGWMTGQRMSVFLGQLAGSSDAVTVKFAEGCER